MRCLVFTDIDGKPSGKEKMITGISKSQKRQVELDKAVHQNR